MSKLRNAKLKRRKGEREEAWDEGHMEERERGGDSEK